MTTSETGRRMSEACGGRPARISHTQEHAMTTEPDLTDTQKAYNVAQYEMFQLAAYGHCTYTNGELLTAEGKRQQADYNDRIRKAREELEAAVLRLIAEHAETFRGGWGVPAAWLRSLADDPAALSLLAVRPDERESVGSAPATTRAALREAIRRAVCEAEGFAWDSDMLEPDEYGEVADMVLAVLPASTSRADQAEAHRLALSTALSLGTGAPWDAIRERAAELAADRLGWRAAAVFVEAMNEGCGRAKPCASCDAREDAAAELRRVADETPRAETEDDDPTESAIYEVVGDWGVDSADSAEGARAAVAKWLRAYPKCGAFAQQRIVREWPDGSEFYGPWTDLPPAAVVAQQTEVVHGCPPDGSGLTPCCGRTPFELPLGDRISSEAPVTCPAAVVAQPAKEARP